MKKHSLTLSAILLIMGFATGQDNPLPPVTKTYALTNVNIVPQPGEMVERGTVVVKDGLIQAVGQDVSIPYDAKVIDADSMYLYAGFIDGLSHTGIKKEENKENENGGRRRGRPDVDDPGNPPNELAGIQPQRMSSDMLNAKERSITQMRELGFTTAHIVPEDGMLPGYGAIILLAGDDAGQMVLREKAAMYAQLDGARGVYPATVIAVMSKFRELYKQAEQASGYEARYTEGPGGMERPEYDPVLKAFYPVLNGSLPIFFRAEDVKTAYRVFALQKELGFPLVLGGLKEGWHLLDQIKNSKTPVFLALELPDPPKEEKKKEGGESEEVEMSEEMKKLEARRAETMEKLESQAATYSENGIVFGFASLDAKSKDIRANLRRMIEAGLSEEAALAALTTTPADMLGLSGSMGTVEPGKIANLVVTDKPYFEEKSNVRYVLVDGRLFEYEKGAAKKAADPKAVASVAGTWNYKIDIPGQTMGGTLTLIDNQGVLEGRISTPQTQQETEILDPVIDGTRVRFVTRYDGGGNMMRVEWTLDVEGDTFEGKVSVAEFGNFDVEGDRVAPPNRN